MVALKDLFGLFAQGLGLGVIISAFFFFFGSFIAFFVRILSGRE